LKQAQRFDQTKLWRYISYQKQLWVMTMSGGCCREKKRGTITKSGMKVKFATN